MPRTAGVAPGGFVYHVLNQSVGRMHMFRKEPDFEAFECVMVLAHLRQPTRILSYCSLSWPANGTARVSAPLTRKELDRVRVSIERGRPYGEEEWVRESVKDLGLEYSVRP
jgi:hypothetical protein